MIKAITAQTNFGLFDVDVTRMQGQFAYLEAKDIEDITSGIIVTEASAVWNGTDTSLTTPTTIQYVGLLTQITNTGDHRPGRVDHRRHQGQGRGDGGERDLQGPADRDLLNPILAT
jgi:hypothetical protein